MEESISAEAMRTIKSPPPPPGFSTMTDSTKLRQQ